MMTGELISGTGQVLRAWFRIESWDTLGGSIKITMVDLDDKKTTRIIFPGANSFILSLDGE